MDAYPHVWDEYCDQYQSDWEAEHAPIEPWAPIAVAYRYGWEAAANQCAPHEPLTAVLPVLMAGWSCFWDQHAQHRHLPPWGVMEPAVHAGWHRARAQFWPQ